MTNRLADTQSLYLRKHAENPIDWWYWGEEALTKSKAEDKPIFLSIGYSSCHWCTVMEGEAFSDPAIAQYLNDNFVPIKVDREERPDLDSIYMTALQMMTGQGGWPLNVFLTPDDLVPFYGGTYFPVEARHGRPSFGQILQSVHRFYKEEKEKLEQFKAQILGGLAQSTAIPASTEDEVLSKALLHQGIETNTGVLSTKEMGPCFPMIPYAEVALRGSRLPYDSRFKGNDTSRQRGLDLALGGIYDHVGGGFHRYTVDATWTVPHFEKMLYDNGQIMEYLANLWSAGVHEPAFERAIAGTAQWLSREMTSDKGYFYAAQDADSFLTPQDAEPEEGAFYVWTNEELEKALTPEEFTALQDQFEITSTGNFEGKTVLQRTQTGELSETVETALSKLFTLRYGDLGGQNRFNVPFDNTEARNTDWQGRIPPVTDPKMITAWNSLMISGLARAAAVFEKQAYLSVATNATEFILNQQWVNGRLHRVNYGGEVAVLGQAEDYALFIKALLDIQACYPEQTQWLEKAIEVQAEFDQYLWSEESAGYYNTDARDDLLVRERSFQDNATPSANGIAIANLVRLFLLTENQDYLDKAEQALHTFSGVMEKAPQACPSLFTALDWYRHATLVRTTSQQLHNLIPRYLPASAYRLETELPENAVALVCEGLSCREPAQTEEQLLAQLEASQKR
jgi:uncharacterized protein YyaL (SSP411 family)